MKQISHPLDNLIDDDRLFLMEAIIPFVDYRLKAPLAVYVKINELICIMHALNHPGKLERCGMNLDIHNQEDIIDALAGCGFTDIEKQFSQMKKMAAVMEMMNMMSDDSDGCDGHEDSENSCVYDPDVYTTDNNTDNAGNNADDYINNYKYDKNNECSLYDNIMHILDENDHASPYDE